MDKEALKLIVRNLDSLVQCLKSELYSDDETESPQNFAPEITDYDEVFDEEMYSG